MNGGEESRSESIRSSHPIQIARQSHESRQKSDEGARPVLVSHNSQHTSSADVENNFINKSDQKVSSAPNEDETDVTKKPCDQLHGQKKGDPLDGEKSSNQLQKDKVKSQCSVKLDGRDNIKTSPKHQIETFSAISSKSCSVL